MCLREDGQTEAGVWACVSSDWQSLGVTQAVHPMEGEEGLPFGANLCVPHVGAGMGRGASLDSWTLTF